MAEKRPPADSSVVSPPDAVPTRKPRWQLWQTRLTSIAKKWAPIMQNLREQNVWMVLLGATLVVAGGLRLLELNSTPLPLADEVYAALDIQAILEKGRHFTGESPGLLAYVTPLLDGRAFAAVVSGMHVLDLRLMAAAFGLGTLGLVYILGRQLGDRLLGVAAAVCLAVMPWHVHFSRLFLPASQSVFLTVLTLVLLLSALAHKSFLVGAAATLAAIGSLYVYPPSILLTPIFVLTILILKRSDVIDFGLRRILGIGLVATLALAPYLIDRFLTHNVTVQRVNSVITEKLIWNHGLSAGDLFQQALGQWASYFSPGFLFFEGDPNIRHSTQAIGQVGWAIGAIACFGIFVALRERTRTHWLLLSWLVVYPFADALTYADAYANSARVAIGSVVWALLAAVGVRFLLQRRALSRPALLVIPIGLILVGQTTVFAGAYFGRYTRESGFAFESGYKPVYDILRHRGVERVPITVHAGYERDEVLEYFTDHRLNPVQTVTACRPLPPNVVRYTVLPRVFFVREDLDFSRVSGCVKQDLIERDIRALRRTGVQVEVLANYPNALGARQRTAILFVSPSEAPLQGER